VSTPYPGTGNPMDSITHATPSPAVSVHDEWDDEMDRQVAGRVACMSLIAAVAAKGEYLPCWIVDRSLMYGFTGVASEEAKVVFKDEAVRLAQDSVHWVRREAAYALGALAKVVPENTIVSSLVRAIDMMLGLSFRLQEWP
jgi:serine/threonine-protein phosphatase 4 regulatory subunit 1